MDNILEVRGLCKSYEAFRLSDVSFQLPKGYIMGFVGPNGAGKTTTIKSILDMIHYDAGEITLFGHAAGRDQLALRDKLGVVMDAPFYSSDWSALDIEKALRPFYSQWDKAMYQKLLRRFDLDARKKVKELSRGMKVKLMMSVALSHGAQLLILDEPTSGLDPVARDELMDLLLEFIADEQRSVLFSTHITADLEKVADFITYIKDGRIVFTGGKDELMEKYCIVRGGPGDLTGELAKRIVGLRRHDQGFEGLLSTTDTAGLPGSVLTERVSLDEIIVFMNKEGKAS